MTSAGCTGEVRGGILYLTLDTRGSSINVLTPAVALELEQELERGLAAGARAAVLLSAKPGSFVNGVGLLLAASSHAESAAMERARTLQRCYERLAAAPVPTIAAIEGNCYGCGLELALTCDYRLAADTSDTHFYMSEIRDYAFIPLFGGTQRLPPLLGLGAGMRMLLGERATAKAALRMGLVDRLAPQGVRRALPSLLRELRARGWPKREAAVGVQAGSKRGASLVGSTRGASLAGSRRGAREALPRIAALPGPERELARDCLRLARLPGRRGYRLEDGLREELASFWRTVGKPESGRAMSFFFTRQSAKVHGIGSASYERPARLAVELDGGTPALRGLGRLLRVRKLAGVTLRAAGGAARNGRATIGAADRGRAPARIGRAGRAAAKNGAAGSAPFAIAFAQEKVAGLLTCALGALGTSADCAALLPFPGEPVPAIELVPASAERPWRGGTILFQLLEQAGFAPVVTRARGRFVSERLLDAFHGALAGSTAAQARRALLDFGFRLPAALALGLGKRTPRGLVERREPATAWPSRAAARAARDPAGSADLAARAAEAVAAEAIRALDDGALGHASQADLLAHVLFGFPVVHGGLLRFVAAGSGETARAAARVLGRRAS